jgi:hypothetical protein
MRPKQATQIERGATGKRSWRMCVIDGVTVLRTQVYPNGQAPVIIHIETFPTRAQAVIRKDAFLAASQAIR